MKKYLIFRFSIYYPTGGFNDFVKDFDTLQEAEKYTIQNKLLDKFSKVQIIDQHKKEIILEL